MSPDRSSRARSAEFDLPAEPGRLGTWLQRVSEELSATFAAVLTVLPCGVLALAMASMPFARDHTRRPSGCEQASWRVLLARRPMRIADKLWLTQHGQKQTSGRSDSDAGDIIAAPLASPVLRGYPGAVLLARDPGQPSHDSDLDRLAALTNELPAPPGNQGGIAMPPEMSVAILDTRGGKPLYPQNPSAVDQKLLEQMNALVRQNLRQGMTRWMARTSAGVMIPFRVAWHDHCPGLTDKPVVWFCRAPSPVDWAALQEADLSGEPEVARLLPAVKMMLGEFARQPSLAAIASSVRLSPFHFHRRFSDCMGITPKHFLLDCQIAAAQKDLLGAEKSLARIAADCGFSHQSHFTSRFKQATGLTPVQWRRLAVSGAVS